MSAAPDLPERLYLAGPMSGVAGHNVSLFNETATWLRAAGHTVFNPAENDDGGIRRPRSFYMRLDIPALLASQAVVLLPGWERSRGASLEVWLAIELDLPVYELAGAAGRITLHRLEGIGAPRLPFESPRPARPEPGT